MRPLYAGDDHNLLRNRDHGDPHPMYGTKKYILELINNIGSATFHPAAQYDAVPDTGADMTANITTALGAAPVGSTLFFEPGTYVVSGPLVHNRQFNIYAYGSIFNFGATALAGPAISFGDTSAQLSRQRAAGFKVIRDYTFSLTPVGTGGTGIGYTAIEFFANNRCVYEDIMVEGFDQAFRQVGANGLGFSGCNENVFRSCRALNNRYSITIEQSGADANINENSWYDFEHQHASAFNTAELVDPTTGIEICRILWGAVAHAPNNNRFFGCNFESSPGKPAHRKARIQGLENYFYSCRWEGHNTVTADPGADGIDITIGKAATINSFMTRNVFFHGDELNNIVDNTRYEFIGTTTANNKNQFITGWGSVWCGGNVAPAMSMFGGSNTTDLIEHRLVTGGAGRTTLTRAQGPGGEHGFYGFYDGSTTLRNYLSLATATLNSVWDLLVDQGLRIGNEGQFYPDAGDLKAFPIGGRILYVGGSASVPPLAARAGSSANPSFGLYLSTDVLALFLCATASAQIGVFQWFDSGGTERNRLAMQSGSPFALQVDHGMVVNKLDASAGDFIVFDGVGGATRVIFADTTNQRVFLGGATHTGVGARVVTLGHKNQGREVRGRTAIAVDATIGVDDGAQIGITSTAAARTLTLPARSAVDPGHTYYFTDESNGAGANNITIQRAGADTFIDGATTQVISTNCGSLTVYAAGATTWGFR